MTRKTDLDIAKRVKLDRLSKRFARVRKSRPRVDTGLGFAVDGGYEDVENLKVGRAMGLTTVKDADNVMQTITLDQWDTIIGAAQAKGLSLYQAKWQTEDAINAATSVQALEEISIDFE